MLNNPRIKNVILFIGGAFIALSMVLFLSAVTIRDFGQPDQENFFTGRSSILLLISFVLLAGLALTLLIIITRTLNRPVSMPASVQAISRQKSLKAGLPDATELIEVADKSERQNAFKAQPDKSAQILSDTAGELRTSVGAIEEELEDMIDDEDPVDKDHMQSLFEETDRLKKIIDGMEQLSQAQSLTRSFRKESIELEALLKAVLEKTRNTAQGRDVTFLLECEPSLTMTADPECLKTIMENLMDNAAKAVKNAGRVTLSAARKGDQVVFSVADTGSGIRAKHLSHIYERFFRGTGIGIGMGLTIVKELVDACGGRIEVQTELGKGSVFTVHISAS